MDDVVLDGSFQSMVTEAAIAGEATASVAALANASGTNLFMGMECSLSSGTGLGSCDRSRPFPVAREHALDHSSSGEALVLGAQAIPEVELDALGGQLHRPPARQRRQHRLERLLLGDA